MQTINMKYVRIEEDVEVFVNEQSFNKWLKFVNNEYFEFLLEDGWTLEDACTKKGYNYKWDDLQECPVHFE